MKKFDSKSFLLPLLLLVSLFSFVYVNSSSIAMEKSPTLTVNTANTREIQESKLPDMKLVKSAIMLFTKFTSTK